MSASRGRPGPGSRPIRVLLGKVGLDGHDRGVRVVARALRDAGMEVVYTGLHRTAAQVVRIAVEEDVDVIGLSILSGAHMTIFPRLLELMRAEELDDVLVVAGGTFLPEDVGALEAMGVGKAFGVDTPLDEIVGYIRAQVHDRILAS
jgi:methylmalonyl-CoA mutase C-terminal domain/subunit